MNELDNDQYDYKKNLKARIDSQKNRYSRYYQKNKDRIALKRKQYREKNIDKLKLYQKEYLIRNRQKIIARNNTYNKLRSEKDIGFKIGLRLRTRLSKALKSKKPGSAIKELGCTIEELKTHLEAQFQPGMSWDNHGLHGWHIDHIKPLSSFDLTDPEQFKQACHYTNLQPLWAEDNLKKSNKQQSLTHKANSDQSSQPEEINLTFDDEDPEDAPKAVG